MYSVLTNVKVALCLLVTLQTIYPVTPLANDPVNPALSKTPLRLHRFRRDNNDIQTTLLDSYKAIALTKDSTPPTNSIIADIQNAIDTVLTFLANLVSSVIPAISNIVSGLQQDLVGPLLTLVNVIASLTIVQAAQEVYVIILVLQTVLNMANQTIFNAEEISNSTAEFIAASQTIVGSTFDYISFFFA